MKKNLGRDFFNLTNDISNLMFVFEFMHKRCTKLGRVECNLLHYLLNEDRPVSMKELAKYLGVTHSRVTHLMDSLIKKGYIDRIASTEDRRVFFASITDVGAEIVNKHMNEGVKVYNKLLQKLSQEKVDMIFEALKLWKDFLEQLPQPPKDEEDED